MVDKNQILIKFYREGKSKTIISKELKISRKTVRAYLAEHEAEIKSENLKNHLDIGLSSKPSYNATTRSKRVLTQEIEQDIKLCLQANKEKINSGMRKQIMKNIDIHNYLLEKGCRIGYTTLCQYISDYKNSSKESFIKQVYSPGHTCEFDWGEVKVFINGELHKFNLAVFTSGYSNFRFAKLFYRQDSLAFAQSHIDFISYTKGAYKEMVYDNMRVAVKRFVGRTEKEATQGLLELSNYYKFDFRFCNIRKGNEKGHVERSVEYVRRKAFCIKDKFPTIEEANAHLLSVCDKLNNSPQKLQASKTAMELFEDEKPNLFISKYPYVCFDNDYAKVDKYSTISYKTNRYSVPDFLVGKLLDIRIFAEKIDVYFNNEFVCSHKRSYGLHSWTMDINHFLTTLLRKPGALKSSVAFSELSDYMKKLRADYFDDSPKDFIELLQYFKDKKIESKQIKKAVDKVISITPTSLSKDKILAVLDKQKEIGTDKNNTDKTTNIPSETEEFSMQNMSILTELINKKTEK